MKRFLLSSVYSYRVSFLPGEFICRVFFASFTVLKSLPSATLANDGLCRVANEEHLAKPQKFGNILFSGSELSNHSYRD